MDFLVRNMVRKNPSIMSLGSNPNTSPFDELYIYRTSTVDNTRIRSEWIVIDEISPKEHEILVTEASITTPFNFTWQVYE